MVTAEPAMHDCPVRVRHVLYLLQVRQTPPYHHVPYLHWQRRVVQSPSLTTGYKYQAPPNGKGHAHFLGSDLYLPDHYSDLYTDSHAVGWLREESPTSPSRNESHGVFSFAGTELVKVLSPLTRGYSIRTVFLQTGKIEKRWFPCNERATAVGLSMGGFHLGNVVGLVLTPIVMSRIGLTGPFVLFSSLGLLWLTTWALRVSNDPQESRSISNSELRLIQDGKSNAPPLKKGELPPLRLLLSKMPTWAIIFANMTNNWGYFVLLSWMPVYFKTVFNVNLKQAAWFSAVPWGTMAFSGYVAGAASDYLIKAGYSLTFVRKVMQSIGFIGPGLALLCLNYAKSPSAASVIITVALSLSSFSQAGFLLNMQDIAPQYAGFLHGISNSAGTLAAIISTIGTGYFVQWLGSFQAFLTVTAGLYFATAIFWNLFATGERVF